MTRKNILLILMILIGLVILFSTYNYQKITKEYNTEVKRGLKRTNKLESSILTEEDISDLPEPVQKYIRFVGAIGKEKVNSFRVIMEGKMKTNPDDDKWINLKIEQYSFLDQPTRMFYMYNFPMVGLHSYTTRNNQVKSTMLVKLAGLISVVDGKGKEMNQGETVTFFNDMCLLAPASLIDDRISWEPIDSLTTKATFTNGDVSISATLYFNEKGELINFVSDDRYYSPTGESHKKMRWSTPMANYKDFKGIMFPSEGDILWHTPGGKYSYAEFDIKELQYNFETLK